MSRYIAVALCLFLTRTGMASDGKKSAISPDPSSAQKTAPGKHEKICGQTAVVLCLRHYGNAVELGDVLSVLPGTEAGTNLLSLSTFLQAYGLKTRGAKLTFDELLSQRTPAILHVDGNHFVLCLPHLDRESLLVIDHPARAMIRRASELSAKWRWEGDCLLVSNVRIPLPQRHSSGRTWRIALSILAAALGLAGAACYTLHRRRRSQGVGGPLSVALVIALAAGSAAGGPAVRVTQPVFDGGVVFDDVRAVEHEFRLESVGDESLRIGKIKSDCSCTVVDRPEEWVRAGSSATVKVTYRLKRRFGVQPPRKIAVQTNDPKNPVVVLVLKITRRRQYLLKPNGVNFGRVKAGESRKLLARIIPGSPSHLVSQASIGAELGRVTVSSRILPSGGGHPKSYLVEIAVPSAAAPGPLRDVVVVPCSGGSVRELLLPVRAEILGEVQSSLSSIACGIVHQDGKAQRHTVWLRCPAGKRPTVVSSPRWAKVDIHQDKAKIHQDKAKEAQWRMDVVVQPRMCPAGVFKSPIVLAQGTSDEPALKIPMSGWRAPAEDRETGDPARSLRNRGSGQRSGGGDTRKAGAVRTMSHD